MEICLVHPEIPHNAGCAARLSAALGVRLHFVKPLGFSLEDRYLKRAGLDYWPMVDLVVHDDWKSAAEFFERDGRRPLVERLALFSARGGKSLFQSSFDEDAVLVFGSESKGLPPELLEELSARRVYLPIRPGVRSLNLANTVAVALYTALDRAGLSLPDNNGTYSAHPDQSADLRAADIAQVQPPRRAE